MSEHMNVEALRQLIRVLQAVEVALPAEQFNMSVYKQNVGSCTTAACAYGHALFDEWFTSRHDVSWAAEHVGSNRMYPLFNGKSDRVVFQDGDTHLNAHDIVFGLSARQFNQLFMPGCYNKGDVRPHHVIERVRELLIENGHTP